MFLICQIKIQQLERKLQEEEHQRKLVQEKANQVSARKTKHCLCYISLLLLLAACNVS